MKKNFKLPVVAALAIALTSPVAMAQTNYPDVLEGKWYTAAIESAVSNNLLSGYEDGTMRPDNVITRAEIACIFGKAFGATEKASLKSFNDVNTAQWFYDAMAKAVNMKIFVGNEQNCLNPSNPITRQEAAIVVAKAFELSASNESSLTKFADRADVANWAAPYLAALVENGYMAGDNNNRLNPKANITRAEFAQIMANITNDYLTAESTVAGTYEGTVVVRSSDVVLKDVTINGDLILADGIGDASFTLENVTITGNLVIRGGKTVKLNNTEVGGSVITRNHNNTVRLSGEKANVEDIIVNTPVIIDIDCPTVTVDGSDLTVSGNGKVEKVNVNGNNVKVTIIGSEVFAAVGTTGVKAGSEAVPAGESRIVKGSAGGGGGRDVSSTISLNYIIETNEAGLYEFTNKSDKGLMDRLGDKTYKVTVKVDDVEVADGSEVIVDAIGAAELVKNVLDNDIVNMKTLMKTIDASEAAETMNYAYYKEKLQTVAAVLLDTPNYERLKRAEEKVLARPDVMGNPAAVTLEYVYDEYVSDVDEAQQEEKVKALVADLFDLFDGDGDAGVDDPIAEIYAEVLMKIFNESFLKALMN